MTKITESQIEQYAIELLETQGYRYFYGPDIAPDSPKTTSALAKIKKILLKP